MSASLGGLLKDYRLQRNIPQLEIAFALGWKDTSRLSRIEQGVVEKPPRELIDKICKPLRLSEQEKNTLLLVGSYLPTKQEVEKIQKETTPYMEKWPYPAAVFDFCSRNILINKKLMFMLGMDEKERNEFHSRMPTLFELLFDAQFTQSKYFTKEELIVWHTNLLEVLTHFKYLQKLIIKDKWFQGVMKKMMNNSLFQELWKKAQYAEMNFITTRHGRKIFVHPSDNKKKLQFHYMFVPLHKDPRFELEFFYPADAETAEFFQSK